MVAQDRVLPGALADAVQLALVAGVAGPALQLPVLEVAGAIDDRRLLQGEPALKQPVAAGCAPSPFRRFRRRCAAAAAAPPPGTARGEAAWRKLLCSATRRGGDAAVVLRAELPLMHTGTHWRHMRPACAAIHDGSRCRLNVSRQRHAAIPARIGGCTRSVGARGLFGAGG